MSRAFRALFAAVLFASSSFVIAAPMAGTNKVFLLVETLDEVARQCGVSTDSLDAAMRIPLSSSKLEVSKERINSYLYVAVTVLRTSNGLCVGNVNMTFNRFVWLSPSKLDSIVVAEVWSRNTLLFAGGSLFSRNVNNAVEDMTKQFIGAWLKDN